jgi:hypothetical protein
VPIDDCVPRALRASTPRLAGGVPAAAPGTLFALAAEGGLLVPPGRFRLQFGRGRDGVHVVIGSGDPYISRLHGVLGCDGIEWWLRNEGRLPIHLPDGAMVLAGGELALEHGYTPLRISTPARRSHLLEVHVVGQTDGWGNAFAVGAGTGDGIGPGHAAAPVVPPATGSAPAPAPAQEGDGDGGRPALSEDERLVLVVLAQRYLRRERHPRPVSWTRVAEDLNRTAEGRCWTPREAALVVGEVRSRLAAGSRAGAEPGGDEEGAGTGTAGAVLNHKLIRALLRSTALLPGDLRLLGGARTPPPES